MSVNAMRQAGSMTLLRRNLARGSRESSVILANGCLEGGQSWEVGQDAIAERNIWVKNHTVLEGDGRKKVKNPDELRHNLTCIPSERFTRLVLKALD